MKLNKILDYAILGVGAAIIAIIQQVVTEKDIDEKVETAVNERFTKEETNND